MTELKTLKDFEVKPKSWAGAMANAGRKYTITIDGLKQEVIKWIKADIEVYKNADIQLPKGEQGRKIHNFIIERRQFWKDRFNIKESDLK